MSNSIRLVQGDRNRFTVRLIWKSEDGEQVSLSGKTIKIAVVSSDKKSRLSAGEVTLSEEAGSDWTHRKVVCDLPASELALAKPTKKCFVEITIDMGTHDVTVHAPAYILPATID